MEMPNYFAKECQNDDKSKIIRTSYSWKNLNILHFEPQRRANNKQWLCKDQARYIIVK